MLRNMSIKVKLIISFAIIAILVLSLASYSILGVSKSADGFTNYREMSKNTVLSSGVQANMLMMRMNVKDYLKTNSQKDIDEFNHYYKKTEKLVNEALKEIKKAPRTGYVSEIKKEFSTYKDDFYKVVDFMNKRNEIYKSLAFDGNEITKLLTSAMIICDADEDTASAIEAGYALRTVLMSRLYTMKFLESNAEQDAKRVHKEFAILSDQLEDLKDIIKNPNAIEKLNSSFEIIKRYKIGVNNIVKIINERNKVIDNLYLIGPNIAKLAEDVKSSIKKDQDTIGSEVSSLNDSILTMSIIIAAVVLLLVILFAAIISREISTQIDKFQTGLLGFFKYLNRETQTVEMLDDSSNNEIGTMSKVVNENIEKTKKGIEEDRKFIDDTVIILSEFEQGDLGQRITNEVNNPALMDLRKVLNSMGEHMEKNINEILDVLEQYTNYNYLNQVQTSSVKHHLLKLSNGVNNLGSSIVTMLTQEKRIGLTLNSSSDTLLKNVNILNDVSSEAAASLEETAAALEEMTGTIVSNTQNVIDG